MKKTSSKTYTKQDFRSMLTQLEGRLDLYFNKKAPALPAGIKEFIVWIAPYLTILGTIVMVPAILALLGISAVFAPLTLLAGAWSFGGLVSLVALIATTVLYVTAIPGLFAKKKMAWDKMFLVSLISVVTSLLSGQLFSLVIGALINWYILFQIRSYYK